MKTPDPHDGWTPQQQVETQTPEPMDILAVSSNMISTLSDMVCELLAKALTRNDVYDRMADYAIEARENLECVHKMVADKQAEEFQEDPA